MGSQLINRSTKLVSMTSAGEIFYEFARNSLRQFSQTEDEISALEGKPRGLIRFCAFELCSRFFLPERIAHVADKYPDIRVDVLYTDRLVDPIGEQLDFALRGLFPVSSELITYPLWRYENMLCASVRYVERMGLPQTPGDLSRHVVVVNAGSARVLHDWYFKSSSGSVIRAGVKPRHTVNNSLALYELLCEGVGVGRLADWVAMPAIEQGILTRVCPDFSLVSSAGQHPQMHVVYGSKGLPRKCRVLLEALRDKPRFQPPPRRAARSRPASQRGASKKRS